MINVKQAVVKDVAIKVRAQMPIRSTVEDAAYKMMLKVRAQVEGRLIKEHVAECLARARARVPVEAPSKVEKERGWDSWSLNMPKRPKAAIMLDVWDVVEDKIILPVFLNMNSVSLALRTVLHAKLLRELRDGLPKLNKGDFQSPPAHNKINAVVPGSGN